MLIALIGRPHVGKSTLAAYFEGKNIRTTTRQEDIEQATVIAFVVDASQIIDEADVDIAESIKNINNLKLLLLNKVDLTSDEELNTQLEVASHLGQFDEILKISSQSGQGIDNLIKKIDKLADRKADETS